MKVVEGTNSFCPLVNRTMNEGECYDVQMVSSHMIKEDVLEFKLDRAKSCDLCSVCPFNQLEADNPTPIDINVYLQRQAV